MTKGKLRTQEEFAENRLTIAHHAAILIFEKGFNKTSVSEIAQAAGIGKSTFYDFFKTKDDVILLLLDEPLAEVRVKAREISASNESVFERISKILQMHLDVLLRDKASIFKLSFEFQRLPMEVQAQHEVKRLAYQDLLIKLINEGIENHSFRSVDADMVMKTLLSILNSVIMTAHPTAAPTKMLDEALDIIFNGISHQ